MSLHPLFRSMLVALVIAASSGVAHAQLKARVQAIHNAADPSLEVIDLYVSGQLVLDDVAFRTASPYLDIPALIPLTGGIAPGNSTGPGDVFFEFGFTLALNQTYQFILVGVRDPGLFLPNPDGRDISLDVLVNEDARELGSDPSLVDVIVVNGTTDAPALDVGATLIITSSQLGNVPLASNLRYSEQSSYETIGQNNVVTVEGSSGVPPFSWHWAEPLYFPGNAVTVLMSGFFDSNQNQNGAEFAPFIVWPNGWAFVLDPITTEIEDNVSYPDDFTLRGNYPNPFNPSTTISFDLASSAVVSIEIIDVLGRRVLAMGGSPFSAGVGHELHVDASSLPSGTYLYRVLAELNSGVQIQTGRMTLLK